MIFSGLLGEGAGEVVLSTERAGFMKGLKTSTPLPPGGGGGVEVCLTLVLALFLTTNDLSVGGDLSVVTAGLPEPRTGLSWILNVIKEIRTI